MRITQGQKVRKARIPQPTGFGFGSEKHVFFDLLDGRRETRLLRSLARPTARPLPRRHGPDDQPAASRRPQRRLRPRDRRGDERSNGGTRQHGGGLEADEASLIAGA